ncbi:hypothetical protein CJF32_00007163 [Rutstroemia sp. NJR-2017a WRK4]|nr:hypothetical protein CJF32_00007163 [Rutstroemia sp. NJR-2017a WRK4]
MMVLSGILKSSTANQSSTRTQRPLTPGASASASRNISPAAASLSALEHPHPYILAREQLPELEAEVPDLRELNTSLQVLAGIFPDVQVEVFREMLASFDRESRLAVVTEHLLKQKMKYVRGRYRVVGKGGEKGKGKENEGSVDVREQEQGGVPVEEKFRSEAYKKAVRSITYHEFKGLSRSTINAVLAEHNHSYTLARPTLVGLSSKSWRFSISSIFLRRKTISSTEAKHHPLVIWQSTGRDSMVPTLKTTGSAELDRELFESLIVPLQEQVVSEREEKDHALALELNNREAEEHEAMHDCECCYTAYAFEELSACDDGGHFVCFQCIRHAVNEAVFGQGWQRNIDLDGGTLRCLAAMSGECKGCIPQALVRRAFLEDKGEEILRKLDERLIEDSLLKTGLPLIRCPFCNYAEVDELYLPEAQRSWRLKRLGPSAIYTLIISILGVGMMPFLFPVFLFSSFLFLIFWSDQSFANHTMQHFHNAIIRLRRKQHGLKFLCQNQRCARASCISCSKGWTDIHICHESSLLALRTQVELAMSLAIKRTCPRCNTSFVKSSGCNKLTCVCGYQMCYVCRKDIGNGEGYRHFCEHFRPNGGRKCTECSKCDLYRCEDDEVVVRKAKEEAERAWLEKEGGGLGDEKVRRGLERKWKRGVGVWWWEGWWAGLPGWEQVVDGVVEAVVE